jgi:catechol 2,3-dioxygenase-like lactoylglutathione lyase family enzyme
MPLTRRNPMNQVNHRPLLAKRAMNTVLWTTQVLWGHSGTPITKERTRTHMQVVDKLMRFKMAVSDMPKAKAFYADKLGLKVATDYRRDEHNWWVSLTLPEGGAAMTLTTAHENMKPGTMNLYFETADVAAAHKELSAKGAKVSEVKDDLSGPGSGVKWFNLEDPDGNQVLLVQA